MRTKIASIAAASIPLILGAAGAFASEPQFRRPTTDRAQPTQPLLARAARAVKAEAPRLGDVSNLWLYPTADEDTVFAQYVATAKKASVTVAEHHFELLKLKGDRIVEQRELTRVGDTVALEAKRSGGHRDWSASIGNGHTTSTFVTSPSARQVGSPASPHWSASIGTGQIIGDSNRGQYATTGVPSSRAPNVHWTSKIGTAHAAEPNSGVANGKVTS